MELDVDLRGFGSATFRREAKQRGLEPDECYKLGKLAEDDVPDIAIEVVADQYEVHARSALIPSWIGGARALRATG